MANAPDQNMDKNINQPDMDQFPQEGSSPRLPQSQSYYQDQYKYIAEAEGFYYQNVLEQYNFLVNYESQSKFQSEVNLANENVVPNKNGSIYSELKFYSDKLKVSSPSDFLAILKEKEPTLIEIYSLIIQFVESLNDVRWIKSENSKSVYVQSVETKLKLINQVIDHAIDGFSFSPDDNGTVRKVVDYLNSPTRLFNIFDGLDQQKIASYFLGNGISGKDFHNILLGHFRNYSFSIRLPENEICFYTQIIYDDEVRKLWDPAYRPKDLEGEIKSTNQTDTIPFHLDYVEDIDRLNREPIAKSIARLLNNQIFKDKKLHHSFMIHLQGAWGDGKSTFLRLLGKHLKGVDENDKSVPEKESKWIVVDFNAWRHQHIDQPWWIFMDTIYKQIQKSKGHKFGIWWKERWWRLITLNSMYWLSFVALLFLFLSVNYFSEFNSLNLKILLGNAESGGKILSVITSYISIIGSAWFFIKAISGSLIPASSQAAAEFKKNVRDPMAVLKKHFEKVIGYVKEEKNVAVFIDDLDRCNAEFTVGLLEGIQTLFKEQAVLYVVAGDRHWISTCFENHYKEYKDVAREPAQKLGHLFLEKAFQLSIRLPKISGNTKKSYWDFILNPKDSPSKSKDKMEAAEKTKVKGSISENFSTADLIKPENVEQIVKDHNINLEQATDLVLEVMDESQEDIKHMLQNHYHLIDPNPRGVKRLANQYTVYRNILTAEGRDFEREKLFRWLILQNKYPVYTDWLETHIDDYTGGKDVPEDLKELPKDEKWKELFFEEEDKTKRVLEPDDIAVFTGLKSESRTDNEGTTK